MAPRSHTHRHGCYKHGIGFEFACVVFALRIEADGWAMVSFVASCIVGITTDTGVESGLGLVPEFDGGDLYPFWREKRTRGEVEDDHGLGVPLTNMSSTEHL